MATHKSAKKRITSNAKKATVNHARLSSIRTSIKTLMKALADPAVDAKTKKEIFKKVESALAKGASKGVVNKKAASRKVSRLSKKVKAA